MKSQFLYFDNICPGFLQWKKVILSMVKKIQKSSLLQFIKKDEGMFFVSSATNTCLLKVTTLHYIPSYEI